MRLIHLAGCAVLAAAAVAVGCKSQKNKFAFLSPQSGQTVTYGQKIALRMHFPDTAIDSVVYSVDGAIIATKQDTSAVSFDTEKTGLGTRNIMARAYKDGRETVAFGSVTVLPDSPEQYGFEVVNEYPHDTAAYTQGLEFADGFLYESTGSGNNLTSSLRKVELATGKVLQKKEITGYDPSGRPYFGEGMTIVGDKIVMLTWLNNTGYVFRKSSFEQLAAFEYQNSRQGWGLCHDGKRLLKTDGSNKLYFLDAETYRETGFVPVYDNNGPVDNINELEYVDGKVYANLYGKDIVVAIDPETGAVVGRVNFVGLYKNPARKPVDEEMNGIAYDRENGRFFVTGKQWDKVFEVRITN